MSQRVSWLAASAVGLVDSAPETLAANRIVLVATSGASEPQSMPRLPSRFISSVSVLMPPSIQLWPPLSNLQLVPDHRNRTDSPMIMA
jgi:hypothetical protein